MVVLDTDGLAKQDKEALDLKTLAADTPEVISRQVIFIIYLILILLGKIIKISYFSNRKFLLYHKIIVLSIVKPVSFRQQ